MKHVFIIPAFGQPEYVSSFISQLGGGVRKDTAVYVHIDTKRTEVFASVRNRYSKANNVYFFSETNSHWGGYNCLI